MAPPAILIAAANPAAVPARSDRTDIAPTICCRHGQPIATAQPAMEIRNASIADAARDLLQLCRISKISWKSRLARLGLRPQSI